jgi:hypothetical protein
MTRIRAFGLAMIAVLGMSLLHTTIASANECVNTAGDTRPCVHGE